MAGPTSEAWERLFSELNLEERLSAGPVRITADEIKALSGREPRLMTKFDTRESRPAKLARYTLLPVTNGSYALLRGDGYADVPETLRVKFWTPSDQRRALLTLPWQSGPSSESQALDMAMATGLLQDFLSDPGARLTIRGRLRAPRFDFQFESDGEPRTLTVDGVQVEVDSGLEGHAIHLVEAKLGARTNFHIRQLYYPMRMWSALVPEKPVTTVFLSWSNRCFSLRSFGFVPLERYHGVRLLSAVDYFLEEPGKPPQLADALSAARVELVEAAPFPQADDMRRVIDVVDAVASASCTRAEIAARYEFDERQADYYANAARFLGLLTRAEQGFELTEIGRDFVAGNITTRTFIVLRQLASRPVFRHLLERIEADRALPDVAEVAEMITAATGLTGATPLRRASTVLAWARWAAAMTRSSPSVASA